jgi:hypothetical protein
MSFTLKVRQTYYEHADGEPSQMTGESIAFIEARRIVVQGPVENQTAREAILRSWTEQNSPLTDLMSATRRIGPECESLFAHAGKLIELTRPDGTHEWVTASEAWVLGPAGQTIERIAP